MNRTKAKEIQKALEARFVGEHCTVINTEEMNSEIIEDGGCIVIRDGVLFAIQFPGITSARKLNGLLEKMRKIVDSCLI